METSTNTTPATTENESPSPLATLYKGVDLEVQHQLNSFNELLNEPPNQKWIKNNNGIPYLPIRITESLLRTFFGVWQADLIGPPTLLGNAVCVSIQLKVYHPVLREWLSYPGVGAVDVQLQAVKRDREGKQISGPANRLDFEKIVAGAIQRNAPAALGFATSNAAKKLGKIFGSDLGGDVESQVFNMYGRNIKTSEE